MFWLYSIPHKSIVSTRRVSALARCPSWMLNNIKYTLRLRVPRFTSTSWSGSTSNLCWPPPTEIIYIYLICVYSLIQSLIYIVVLGQHLIDSARSPHTHTLNEMSRTKRRPWTASGTLFIHIASKCYAFIYGCSYIAFAIDYILYIVYRLRATSKNKNTRSSSTIAFSSAQSATLLYVHLCDNIHIVYIVDHNIIPSRIDLLR